MRNDSHGPALFLVHVRDEEAAFARVAEQFDAFEAGMGLWFLRWDGTRSTLYHALKRLLRPSGPFLVAPLAEAPKFKNLQPGALAWLRERA